MNQMPLTNEQLVELERIREWACCFEPERRFMAEVKIAQLEAENERLQKPNRTDCIWTYDDNHDYWETTCGNLFVIIEGTPVENNMVYCPYCGGRLLDKALRGE